MVRAMTTEPLTAKEIFVELIGNVVADRWEERLVEACAGDVELEHRVRALLRAHAESGSFLDQPAVAADNRPSCESSIIEQPGAVIGPYRLLEQIGEGGFAVVFMAEQAAPVRRKVALKIIKPGMDTRQVIARFEAERQALAMMDHPNIAKVFDAGMTGSPYDEPACTQEGETGRRGEREILIIVCPSASPHLPLSHSPPLIPQVGRSLRWSWFMACRSRNTASNKS